MTVSEPLFTRFLSGSAKGPNNPNRLSGLRSEKIVSRGFNRKHPSEGSEGSETVMPPPRVWLGIGLLNTAREVQA